MSDPMKTTGKKLVFCLILLLFLAGVLRLFVLRFEKGDIYPPGSSFRSDPLGCRALYDALVHTGRVDVRRNVRPLRRLDTGTQATVFVTAMAPWDLVALPARSFDALDTLVKNGGRLVLCYRSERLDSPVTGKNGRAPEKPSEKRKPDKKSGADTKSKENSDSAKQKGPAPKADESSPGPVEKVIDAAEVWGFRVQAGERPEAEARPSPKFEKMFGLQPRNWQSALVFTELSPAFQPVYTLGGKVVLMERKLGKGSLVLASDSSFLTNGDLKKKPDTRLLSFVLGRNNTVIFDESHFGIRSETGVAGLVKQFGLQNLVWALILFCLLYVWKNAGYFVPPPETDQGDTVSDRDQASGLASLYKRHIPEKDLLAVCVREWESWVKHETGVDETVKQRIRNLAGEKDGNPPDPVAGYRAIRKILSERKTL